jgi:hypothetical protein
VILNIQPISDLPAIAIDRERFTCESIQNHQRDKFFRELVRTVIIRAIGYGDGQVIGMVIGSHQVIAGSLGCRIWRMGSIGSGFSKRRFSRSKASMYLVGGYLVEAFSFGQMRS